MLVMPSQEDERRVPAVGVGPTRAFGYVAVHDGLSQGFPNRGGNVRDGGSKDITGNSSPLRYVTPRAQPTKSEEV